MKQKFNNMIHLEGYFYDHKLEEKKTGASSKNPGSPYITGIVYIATDEKMLNIVPVHFRFVSPVTSKGNTNTTYTTLEKMIRDNKTVMSVGKENAEKLTIDTSIRLNEWYRDLKDEKPVSTPRAEGGFVHIVNEIDSKESVRNKFKVDVLITGLNLIEPDESKNITEHLVVRGAIFDDYSKAILPMQFTMRNPAGIKYFMGLEPSPKEPVFTCIWGKQVSQTVRTETTVESAFGEDEVVVSETTNREFMITGANPETYVFDDEDYLTKEEVSKMMSDRELYLATIKKNQAEYQNKRAASSAATANIDAIAEGKYDF